MSANTTLDEANQYRQHRIPGQGNTLYLSMGEISEVCNKDSETKVKLLGH